MKTPILKIVLFFVLFFLNISYSQTTKEKNIILKQTNVSNLKS